MIHLKSNPDPNCTGSKLWLQGKFGQASFKSIKSICACLSERLHPVPELLLDVRHRGELDQLLLRDVQLLRDGLDLLLGKDRLFLFVLQLLLQFLVQVTEGRRLALGVEVPERTYQLLIWFPHWGSSLKSYRS